jgi:hypothetical protein
VVPDAAIPKDLPPVGAIFVVGSSRSGTTLMGRILALHPEVFTFNELHFFEGVWAPSEGARTLDRTAAAHLVATLLARQRRGFLTPGSTADFREEALALLGRTPPEDWTAPVLFRTVLESESSAAGKRIPCEKTPRTALYLGEVLDLWPDARVIMMVRDPRDVLLSQKNKWRRRFLGARGIPLREAVRAWINYHPYVIAKLWLAAATQTLRFRTHPRALEIRFEDLVSRPADVVPKICTFLGISYVPTMLEVPHLGSSRGQDDPEARGFRTDAKEAWRRGGLSREEIYICERVTRTTMTTLDYRLSDEGPRPVRLALSGISFLVHAALAFVVNLRRVRNLRTALARRLAAGG